MEERQILQQMLLGKEDICLCHPVKFVNSMWIKDLTSDLKS
jgi:hypothetical protein